MKASVRFDHQLLAVEGEHTVHGMLELVAPQAPCRRSLKLPSVAHRNYPAREPSMTLLGA